MADAQAGAIPVLRPKLADADALMPYLRRIDQTRVYSNQGSLSLEFERRACAVLDMPPGSFIAAASGTAALVAAILATAGRASGRRPLALIPGFTFIATASAVEQCGYTPYLVDVSESTWALDPGALLKHPILEQVGVVVPVAPFGRPQRQDAWRAFHDETSIPVVFDGAASFDVSAQGPFLGKLGVAMSFNATKAFATGEGGGVVTSDRELAVRVRRALNFGFFMSRESRWASMNGKMSEYHAAVGLAELDAWDAKRSALGDVAYRYQRHAQAALISKAIVAYPDLSSSYVLYRASDALASRTVEAALGEASIGTRHWYGFGLHREPYFANVRKDELNATDRLSATLLGIPVAPDLHDAAIERIVMNIARVEGEQRALT